MKDHSQTGEQAVILDYFGGFVGRFLDIGANDGETFSNTRALAEMGWAGTCVEPNPRAFERLMLLYHDRNDVKLIEAAVTRTDGTHRMHMASDSLVSSLDVNARETWERYGFTWTEEDVRGITVATMLSEAPGPYDLISIDAEGHDLEILEQMDLGAMGCRLLVIEHGVSLSGIRRHCAKHGMRLHHHNGINTVFAR